MKEFDYDLDYKKLDFTDAETRKLFIVLEGENKGFYWYAYTDDICAHWRFVDETAARKSSTKIYEMFCQFKTEGLHWYGHEKFLEMGFTKAVGMLIIPVEGSIIKALVKSDPKTRLENEYKSKSAAILRKLEINLHTILNTKK